MVLARHQSLVFLTFKGVRNGKYLFKSFYCCRTSVYETLATVIEKLNWLRNIVNHGLCHENVHNGHYFALPYFTKFHSFGNKLYQSDLS